LLKVSNELVFYATVAADDNRIGETAGRGKRGINSTGLAKAFDPLNQIMQVISRLGNGRSAAISIA
jgi:hypothetical protein